MNKNYLLLLFSLYTIISFGQFDVSEMEILDNSTSNSYLTSAANNTYKFTFVNNGSKMYLFTSGNAIHEYILDVPYSLSTLKFDKTFNLRGRNVQFNSDGTEAFIITEARIATITKYNLSIPYELSSATAASSFENFTLTEQFYGDDFFFNNDGTKMFIKAFGPCDCYALYQFSLINPYDVSSANYDGDSEYLYTSLVGSITDFHMLNDGLTLYITGISDDKIEKYNLSTPFDISTASHDGEDSDLYIGDVDPRPYDINFNADGSEMFVLGRDTKTIYKYDLSTPFDVSTGIYNDISNKDELNITVEENSPKGLTFNNDGTKMFTVGENDDAIVEYILSTGYDLSTVTYSGASEEFSVTSQEPTPQDIQFNNNGTKMYIIGSTGDNVLEYNLSAAYDVSTASYNGDTERFSVKTQEAFPTGLTFNNNGTKMFVVGHQSQAVLEYSLSTAYDVSTASYNGDSEKLSISGQETTPEGILFNNNGSKLYVLGSTSDSILEYSLTTPYDVSTASYLGTGDDLEVNSIEDTPTAFAFNNDGDKLFIVGETNSTIYTFESTSTTTLSEDLIKINTNQEIDIYLKDGAFISNIDNAKISIYNILGQKKMNSDLESGVYLIIVNTKEGLIYKVKKAI